MRELAEGIGVAVAERTILRKKFKGSKKERYETWGEVADRVAMGNSLLCPLAQDKVSEYKVLKRFIGDGKLITSGRHLQHGDQTQPTRNMEVFTNCSTSFTTFGLVYLLLNGSGVGRCYDDDLMLVDWDNAPNVLCVLDSSHPDFDSTAHESLRDAKHKYGGNPNVIWYTVGDSREGWGNSIEYLELLAFEKIHSDKLLILDFSPVRCKNSPIGGMQDRPASGPVPLMNAFQRVNSIKGAGMPKWKQAMYIDHYFAECVLVGGVRRSARMSTKDWRDPSIFEFIQVKRPIEFQGLSGKEVQKLRENNKYDSFLWSSNNSVMVDSEFWELLELKRRQKGYNSELAKHARKVFQTISECGYYDGTGEPGLINVDKLVVNNALIDSIKEDFLGSKKFQVQDGTAIYLKLLLKITKSKKYCMVVNPCSEIVLAIWGAFCVIADVCFYHCESLDDCERVVRAATRFLIRANTLDSIYSTEVKRTNRIGVGLTGIHEFAWSMFGFDFLDLVDEQKSQVFWNFLGRMKRAVRDEAISYSKKLGVVCPHTDTTIKPSGSVSKLFNLTEGWHLPAMAWYLRWVQFDIGNPLVEEYRNSGYPIRELKQYKNTVIVGFPTVPEIAKIMPPDRLVVANQATPEQQYRWLMLGEKYWIRGVEENGQHLAQDTGNQISYTLKYDPKNVSFEQFKEALLKYQSKVRCCSVMPFETNSGYEYLPEEPVSQAEYLKISKSIKKTLSEDIDRTHIDCSTGACPVDIRGK
jgi:adenosylcobalamin-dependent ribonucleoside-triphosphate reductase